MTEEIDRLSSLLDEERRLVLAGELGALEGLLSDKEALIDNVNASSVTDTDALKALDIKLRRNQLLLNGAMEGIQAVSLRLAALRSIRDTVETYDATGRKKKYDTKQKNRLEKRA